MKLVCQPLYCSCVLLFIVCLRVYVLLLSAFIMSIKNVCFQLFSFNVRGLGQKVKRNIIFDHLKQKSKKGIFLLQETHSSKLVEKKWEDEWGGKILYSHGSTDSCGVMILLSPGMDINYTNIDTNNEGRTQYIEINMEDNSNLLLANIYAPTRNNMKEQLSFLTKLKSKLETLDYTHLAIGGDYNTIFNPDLDKQGGNMTNCTNEYTNELINFMETYEMVDTFRMMHPDKKLFTRTQRNPMVLSRIDHWLLSSELCNYIKSCTVYPGVKSDHSIICVDLDSNNSPRGRGFWKFNSHLLHDKDYVDMINELLVTLEEDCKEIEDKGLKWDHMKCQIRGRTIAYSIKKKQIKKERTKSVRR